ncbi:hypothetical protein SASPL_103527 [Salvia splendens]|uniref:Zeta-carotene desaturase n=1 Tax=Salvia splendens TaxID=180675 RepID=A0A8X8YFD4_SALSN|nr:GDSL esterase/lipase At1g71691-like [Salvia splendens]KAG6431955.1 hypothetical protein SASPL_103527 [Salvia splendens]
MANTLFNFFMLFLSLTAGLCYAQDANGGGRRRKPLAPAMFVFGDSLIDSGNNNNLPSFAKANYFPYGIDFNDGPTGRFSNGYTMVDTIAKLLGLPLIPPHSEASGKQMKHGVNFASAASGILDITGRNFMGRIPFNQQISYFENSLDQLTGPLGASEMAHHLSRCIFFIGMGSNDYLNNYLLPNYDTKNQYDGQQYADFLVKQYSQQLMRLYNLGARKFVVAGLGQMGCIPSILAQSRNGLCNEEVNKLILPFNMNTKVMINNLIRTLPGIRFSYIDINNMFQDLLANARSYGFSVVNRGCCGIGRNRGQITCLPFQRPCRNRNRFIFWDAFHPTEAVNVLFGKKAFNGSSDVVYPVNIAQLARL